MEGMRSCLAQCANLLTVDEKQAAFHKNSMERGQEAINASLTTKMECLIGRSLLRVNKKDKQKKLIERYKLEFEEEVGLSAKRYCNPLMWAVVEKVLEGKYTKCSTRNGT